MNRSNSGCLVTLLIGIILGIIVGYFVYILAIPGIVAELWIGFGIGVGALVLTTITALFACGKKERCVCKNGNIIAISAIGTVITTIIGLAITITAESIGTAVLIGLATLFLTMTLLNVLRLIICLTNASCECRQ